MSEHPRDGFMRRVMSNLDGNKDRQISDLLKALKQIEYASRKDSLTEHERLQSVRTVVCAALSQHAHSVGALPPRAPSSQPADSAGAKTGGGK